MLWSFVYLAVRNLFALVLLLPRSDRSKELEILVLRQELAILRRQRPRGRLRARSGTTVRVLFPAKAELDEPENHVG